MNRFWTNADFPNLSWHNNCVPAFGVIEGEDGAEDLVLDIDHIASGVRAEVDVGHPCMHKLDNSFWDAARYAVEKRRFIADRLRHRFIAAHTWLIFSATWASGWGVSGLLLFAGMKNMPLRYGLALAVSYPVFFLCVRVWAGAMRSAPAADNRFIRSRDLPDLLNVPADGEGCLVALVALAVGGLLAVVFMLIGGPEFRCSCRRTPPF